MMMIADTNGSKKEYAKLSKELEELGRGIGVVIKLQREEIFQSMQRI